MLYITPDIDHPCIAYQVNSLTGWIKRTRAYTTRINFPTTIRVFKSKAAFHDGFDYTVYQWNGKKMLKSNAQPCVMVNRIFGENNYSNFRQN